MFARVARIATFSAARRTPFVGRRAWQTREKSSLVTLLNVRRVPLCRLAIRHYPDVNVNWNLTLFYFS